MKSEYKFAIANTVTIITEKTSKFAIVGENMKFIPVEAYSLNKNVEYLFGVTVPHSMSADVTI